MTHVEADEEGPIPGGGAKRAAHKYVNSRERASRDAEIIQARARGFSWNTIALRFGVSDRHSRRIVEEYRQSRPSLHQIDPIDTIEAAIASYDQAIEDFAVLAEQTTNDAVRLGAIRSRLDALGAKLALMNATGLMPDFQRLRVEVDLRRVVDTVVEVFDAHMVPRDAQMAVAQALGRPNGGLPKAD
jgi:hypothetical protein